ncbi:MAG: sigma-70 family RNA polymerase sigma factor [Vicinamibacterales bacterium]
MAIDDTSGDITALLQRHHLGDREAFDQLVPLVYEHLRRVARGQLARGWRGDTVNTRVLVHEAYMQLVEETGVEWQDRGHFFAICARAMRRILVDHARRRGAVKRGAGRAPITLDGVDDSTAAQTELIAAVDEALASLSALDERLARVVECRYFAGMTETETAVALGTSVRTVQRDWLRARAWLLRELGTI